MKLVIQIPCYNEENTIEKVIEDLPKKIEGIDEIEYLIINDGSTDKTVEIAKAKGAKNILNLEHNKGLANAFKKGIEESLKLGADIIVNTDGDNQYQAKDIEKLVKPIIEKSASLVIGTRDKRGNEFFQCLGSWIVRKLSHTNVMDATSGFRAYSREVALKINVFNDYTYTVETIIQFGMAKEKIECVNIRTNKVARKSRLMKNIFQYMYKQYRIMLNNSMLYHANKMIFVSAVILLIFLIWRLLSENNMIYLAMIFVAMFITLIGSIILYNVKINRKFLEDIQYRIKKNDVNK